MVESKILKEEEIASYSGDLYHSWKFKNPKGSEVKCKALSGTGEITLYKNSRKVGIPYIISADNPAHPTAIYLNTGNWASPKTVTLQSGETLLKVARRFGVSINKLREKNKITNSAVYPGTILEIPDSEWEVWIREMDAQKHKFKVELL